MQEVAVGHAVPEYRAEGSGPPIVYIAGIDGTGELLFKQIPALARSHRVVTFRLRDRVPFDYGDLAADVAAIVRSLGTERATLLGESFGGTIALQFALRHPAMVDRVVIVNSFPRFRRHLRIRLAARLAPLLPHRVLQLLRRAANSLALRADGVTAADRQRFFRATSTVDSLGYAQRLALIAQLDLEARLSDIRVPVLFVAAERDMLVPSAREARYMAQRIPNAEVRIIRGAGHSCLMGSRVCLADLIAGWAGGARSAGVDEGVNAGSRDTG